MNSTNKTKEQKLKEYFNQGFEIRLFHCLMGGDTGIHVTDIEAIKSYNDSMLELGVKIGNEWVFNNSQIPELEPLPNQIKRSTITAPIQHLGWATTFNDDSLQIAIFHGPDVPTPDQEYLANERINQMLRANDESSKKEQKGYILIDSDGKISDIYVNSEDAIKAGEYNTTNRAKDNKPGGYQILERRIIR